VNQQNRDPGVIAARRCHRPYGDAESADDDGLSVVRLQTISRFGFNAFAGYASSGAGAVCEAGHRLCRRRDCAGAALSAVRPSFIRFAFALIETRGIGT
jgi:hypothetical protein